MKDAQLSYENNKQKYQYEFLRNNPILRNAGPWEDDIYRHNYKFAFEHFDKFTILCPQEVFPKTDYLNKLQDVIRSYPARIELPFGKKYASIKC